MLIKDILYTLDYIHVSGPSPEMVDVQALYSDSRAVTPGALFVALVGEKVDGHAFIEQALGQGAKALVVEQSACGRLDAFPSDICVVAVESTQASLYALSSAFYGYPQRKMRFVGITGTNGKTTISYLLEKICTERGLQVGIVGTVNYRFHTRNGNIEEIEAPFTTPDPLTLLKILAKMADAGVSLVIMEVSSHALVQRRIGDILFDVAVFTNLTHDHLDYHRSMEEYFAAKSLLFLRHLQARGTAVVVCREGDSQSSPSWAEKLIGLLDGRGIAWISAGEKSTCRIALQKSVCALDKTTLSFALDGKTYQLVSPLVGRFNIDNMLAALGVAVAMSFDVHQVLASLASAQGAPGRLQRVSISSYHDVNEEMSEEAAIFVDYAHTPDALLNVLKTLKQVQHNRLICVFGCGGNRDTTKRPEMGKIVSEWADFAIVTDDNPRMEDPESIRREIVAGIDKDLLPEREKEYFFRSGAEKGFMVIGARQQAITCAVQIAEAGDIVLIAGKGHEKYQITEAGKHYFDDVLTVQEVLTGWRSDKVAEALGCSARPGERIHWYTKISTDSRAVQRDQLFVALKGDNFDGHDYLLAAVRNGATGLVVSQTLSSALQEELAKQEVSVFQVNDTLQALGDLASWRRRALGALSKPMVVGITGSCGKTTVKEMISAIFSAMWPDVAKAPLGRVLKTEGNLNNLVGLPLSLLPLQLHHQAAVMEMGMSHPGEIATLTHIVDPDICCIVNVRGAHLEGLGTLENVGKAKEEMFQCSGENSTLVINLDDPYLRECRKRYNGRKMICFKAEPSSENEQQEDDVQVPDVWATDICVADNGLAAFQLHIGKQVQSVSLPLPGRHNVANALAAAAMAHAADMPIEKIVAGLTSFSVPAKRLELLRDRRGFTVMNDTYNANPASMEAGIDTLVSMKGTGKVAILGDMFELGAAGAELHTNLGRMAAEKGVDYLLVVGSFAQYIVRGARQGGLDEKKIFTCMSKDDVAPVIEHLFCDHAITETSCILVKASRGMHFETIVGDIIEDGSLKTH